MILAAERTYPLATHTLIFTSYIDHGNMTTVNIIDLVP